MSVMPGRRSILVAAGAAAAAAAGAAGTAEAVGRTPRGPVVIGHRGAAGWRPEHTAASYTYAVRAGADWIEPDLVVTGDQRLVVRHENEISGTTDIAAHPEFADRRTTKTIDGRAVTGWFTEDFTLAELRTLRAVERLPAVRNRNTVFDGREQIMTFEEVVELARDLSRRHRRTVAVFPETKHPTYFRSIGLPWSPCSPAPSAAPGCAATSAWCSPSSRTVCTGSPPNGSAYRCGRRSGRPAVRTAIRSRTSR